MKILLIASVGTRNFGDEAMFKSIFEKLKDEGYEITVATYKVEEAKKRFPQINFLQLPNYSGKILKRIFESDDLSFYAENYDALYIAGAGALNSLYSSHVLLLWKLVKLFKKKEKYVEFRPQSIGPFYGKLKIFTKKMVHDIVRLSDKFFVRDKISYEYLKNKNLKPILKKDDAWDIKSEEPNLDFGKCVGLSVRPWKKGIRLEDYFVELAKILKDRGYSILFIPIAYGGNSKYIDNRFLKGIVDGYFLEDYIDIEKATPEVIKGVIKKCHYTIGMSYHFNVFSLSLGKKAIAIYSDEYYRIKNLGLYKAWSDEKYVFKIPDTPPMEIINTLLGD